MAEIPPFPETRYPGEARRGGKGRQSRPALIFDESAEEWVPTPVEIIPEEPPAPPPRPGLTLRQVEHARSLIAEAQRRSIEALKLYEPLPSQLKFHLSMSRQRISRGSNRSGKTTVTMVELAMAATGQHWTPGKYPLTDGRAIVVAKDLDKIGEVIWRKLGRAGAFQIVKDPRSGQWRAYRPKTDQGLKTKPAPPLIPPRMIKEIAWELKKSSIPKKVLLKNGWEISFYSSKSDPFSIQGTDLDFVAFDEEIIHHSWYAEAVTRLIDRTGWFTWSATPQTGTQQLYDLHLRAEAWGEDVEIDPKKAKEVAPVTEVFMSIWDNPHLPEQARRDFVDSLDDDERRVRVDGEFAITGFKVYEAYFFPRSLHCVEPFAVPANWTRFAIIDPGAQVGAVLFAAVPTLRYDGTPGLDPTLFGDFIYFYDEIYLRGCDARKLATRMRQKIGDQVIEEFIIDHRGGRLTEIGSGKTPEQQYREAFAAEKVVCVRTGSSFTYGSDDLDGGILRVKEFLRLREDGTSKLRFLRGATPNAVSELEHYQWKVVMGVITDKPVKKRDHLADCLRYCCMHRGLKHVKPRPSSGSVASAFAAFKALVKREKNRKVSKNGAGVTLG